MVSASKFIFLCSLILSIKPIFSKQFYDNSNCTDKPQVPGSNYICVSTNSCDTFIVYRAQKGYQTLTNISKLFDTNVSQLLSYNNMSENDSSTFHPGHEIIIPVTCSCLDRFSQAVYIYNASHSDSLETIACQKFEGLVKAQSLVENNPDFEGNKSSNYLIRMPLRCACPDSNDTRKGINFLVTYPLILMDTIPLIARKFGMSEQMILDGNRLDDFVTVFPGTTLLIPTVDIPVLNFDEDPAPSPQHVIPIIEVVPSTKLRNKNISGFVAGGICAIFVILAAIVCGVLIFIRKKNRSRSFGTLFVGTSPSPHFSPDFLDGVSKLKHSLKSFRQEELRIATENFSEACMIGTSVYCGKIGGSYVAIEQMNSEKAAHRVKNILTKINHLNVVKLEGCCYGITPYLVFEFAHNGSLRDCLSNYKLSKQFTWTQRLQIAFDLAMGLHYIHHCTKPTYVHRNINSKTVLITMDWRAKISGFRLAKPLICREEKEETNWNESVIGDRKGYLAPEYTNYGQASTKMDVYAFGVVLLELLSGKEAIAEGYFLKDSLSFLANGEFQDSSGCLEKLKGFMDPNLVGDYPMGDAICLAILAKGCVAEDPQHRPTMNDVLKALSRIL